MTVKTVFQSTRPPFLILTPVCVFLGASTAIANNTAIDGSLLVLAVVGAVFAHISVNTFNEYFDFKSGLDLLTTKTPFSGGSGALPANPEMLNAVLAVGIVTLVATLSIGIFFVWKYGIGIVPIGIIGVVLIVAYTEWINRYPYLCLVAPGLGFGFLMVVGTQFVLEGSYSPLSFLVAAVPFFLVNNLLLLNQYPDIRADSRVGRNHFPIANGITNSNRVYAGFTLATGLALVAYVVTGYLPALSLIALLPLPLAIFSLRGAIRHGENIGGYPHYLGANVAVAVITPLLLGLSIIFG